LADRTPLVTVLSTRPHGRPTELQPRSAPPASSPSTATSSARSTPTSRRPERILAQAAGSGVDLPTVTAELEREGVASFCDSYRELLDCIQTKHAGVAA
jgi:hypothetical protein